jgi:raffinose/stachyose/melibiose transport system substrate-binding protein
MRLMDQLLEKACGPKIHDSLKSLQADWSQEPGVTKAYTELKLWADRYLPRNYLGVEPTEGIIPAYRGEAAMQYEGGWLIPRLVADGQDLNNWGYFPFPTETDRIYFFSEELFITKRSRHKEDAAKFIDFWTSREVQQKYVAAFGGASPTVGVEFKEGPAMQQDFYRLITNAKRTFLPADMALPLPVVQAYFKANDQVVSGEIEPTRAGRIVQDAVEKYQKEKR